MSAADAGAPGDGHGLDGLVAALSRLDRLIDAAVAVIAEVDPTRATDQFRGMYVGRDDVARLLGQRPASSAILLGATPGPDETVELARLAATFGLTGFDVDLLLLALAPEIDLRYERLFGFLADDLTKRRCTVNLALDLLCGSAAEKVRRRAHLSPAAPLLRHGLVSLHTTIADEPPAPLLAHVLVPDGQVVGYLLGEPAPGRRLAAVAELVDPDDPDGGGPDSGPVDLAGFPAELAPYLSPAAGAGGQPPRRLYLHGPAGRGQRAAAESFAAAWQLPLLAVDLDQPADEQPDALVALAAREALLRGAVLYLEPVQALGEEDASARRRAGRLLAGHPGPVVLAGAGPWRPGLGAPGGMVTVACGLPAPAARRQAWRDAAGRSGVPLSPAGGDQLGDRFRLTVGQIAEAVETAASRLPWPATLPAGGESAGGIAPPGGAAISGEAIGTGAADGRGAAAVQRILVEAAREHGGAGLDRLARRIPCRHGWDDLVLPPGELAQLREIGGWVDHRQTVHTQWGFGRTVPAAGGVTALFAGPPGTGKTLAAEVVAGHLGYDLCRVDLAQVVSKYIGETEKNLDAVFTAASDANVVLLFDEADALFGKRSAVQDAHDRYANLEIAYLLQKMEEFDGVVVLATNLRENLDQAFLRRIGFAVSFPFPDEAARRRIWRALWPAQAPLGADVAVDLLAAEIALAGGHLRNIAVAAAYSAAARGGPIRLPDVLAAARREYDKVGLVPPALVRDGGPVPGADLGTAAVLVNGSAGRGSTGVR